MMKPKIVVRLDLDDFMLGFSRCSQNLISSLSLPFLLSLLSFCVDPHSVLSGFTLVFPAELCYEVADSHPSL